jgi:eukaryotic-like serine/threonine-protein kinase
VDSFETLLDDRLPDRAETQTAVTVHAAAPRRPRPHPPIAGGQPQLGTLLCGRYLLIERLGAGGFGVVWRCRDELLHREVALKRIPFAGPAPAPQSAPASLTPPGGLAGEGDWDEEHAGARATREALAAARLSHPGIVALYEAFRDDDAFYLVSELIDGQTLAAMIAQDSLTDEQVLQIGVTLAQALEHAHARGVVHRDVKPHNVLVPVDPRAEEAPAKLTDFGGAWLVDEDALTRTGETLGTLAYMAPEQSEGREVGVAADLYSLALVLREGLTGVNPVRGPTPAATARRIGCALPTLARERPDLPRALVRALDGALLPDPRRRGDLRELRGALERAPAESQTRERRPSRGRPGDVPQDHLAPAGDDFEDELPADQTAATRVDRLPNAPVSSVRVAPAPTSHARGESPTSVPPVPGWTEQSPPAPSRRHGLPLPRVLWAGCTLAGAAWLVSSARPGAALLLLAAMAPVLILLGSRPGIDWLAAMLAPALGLVGLAGVYPALAGQAARVERRALLGALGYWWLTLAGALLSGAGTGSRLWLAPPGGLPARAVWEGSLDGAASHVIAPALSAGVLFGAVLWAGAAVVLPWVVRGRNAIVDTLAAVAWSAALLATAPYFDAGLSGGAAIPHPRGAVWAAVLGAAVAVAARALRGPIADPDR